MSTLTLDKAGTETILRNWLTMINHLFHTVEHWADESGWQTEYTTEEVREQGFGSYQVPVLLLNIPEIPNAQIIMEPQAANAGGRGRVKVYASDSLYRVRLLPGTNEDWTILTDSGISLHDPWDKKTFTTLAKDLLKAE